MYHARVRTLILAVCLVSACAPPPIAGEPGSSLAPTLQVAADAPASVMPAAAAPTDCRVARPSSPSGDALFVAIADLGSRGVAFVLDAATAAVRGRIETASADATLDTSGGQLLVFCGSGPASQLVAYDVRTLYERWRARVEDRLATKAPGGIPVLAVSEDGRLLIVMHYKTLRPGDANAPGASRYWVSAHDARTGASVAEVELPDCGAGGVHAVSSATVYVRCRDGLRVIDTAKWRVIQTYALPVRLQPVRLVAGERLYGVSRELRVIGMDMRTGTIIEDSSWADGAGTANAWGHLAIAADRSRLWVLTKRAGHPNEYGPDTLTEIDLRAGRRTDIAVPDLRGAGVVGSRMVYFAAGRLRSTDGAFDVPLLTGRIDHWHILAAPGVPVSGGAGRGDLAQGR